VLGDGAAYDVAVLGLGVMGAATARALARRGARVVGLDRYAPPHPFGSSHGRTRVIRQAYFEGDVYVPLVRRALAGWHELEAESGRTLYRRTGGLTLSPPGGSLATQAAHSARSHDVPAETLDGAEVRRRFPHFLVPDDEAAVWEPNAGVLAVEAGVEALLDGARKAGAELRYGHAVTSWSAQRGGVALRTDAGDVVRARRLVLAAGPWLPGLLGQAALPLRVERSVVVWMEPASAGADPGTLPVFIQEYQPDRVWYGVGEPGCLKAGLHHGGELRPIDALRREVSDDDVIAVRNHVGALLPDFAGAVRAVDVCPYTNMPDEHFLLDRLPGHNDVVVLSACSGHGFKFGPALGALAAELALEGKADVPSLFGWR
jgi:sarcosine oxidase